MKVLVSDALCPAGIQLLESFPEIKVDQNVGLKQDQLCQIIGDYDALIVRSNTKVTREVIEAGKKLRVVGRAGIGVDNVDVPAATERGIVVMNAPLGNTITTAEHSISLLMSLARMIPQASASLQQNRWERKGFMGVELYGKTLGVIGLGRIGREVTRRARALGMTVVAYDPVLEPKDAEPLGVRLVSLQELYPIVDFITFHTPLTEETKNLINRQTISQMKPGVRIINCARGGIVNEQDLYEAIASGKVAGAALDVFEKEPTPTDNPLLKLDQVVCTPHLGASTAEAQENVAVEIAHQVANMLIYGAVVNAVNAPSITAEAQQVLSPYLKLAASLGKLASQLTAEDASSLSIEYSGEIYKAYRRPVGIALLQAFLSMRRPDINMVNTPAVAKQMGLKVEERMVEDDKDYTNLITVRLKSAQGEKLYAGTILSGDRPRIIRIEDFELEVIPKGYILIFFNQDRPGVVGNIGSVLGEEGINIAGMHFGRMGIGGQAITIFRVDTQVPPPVLERLTALPNINTLKQVQLS